MFRPAVLLLCAALFASACTGAAQGISAGGFVAGDGSAAYIPAEQREAAPAVSGDTLEGEPLALSDFAGPVVVNFWASWCGPCAKEAPALQNVAKAYDGQVDFVGVNVKDHAVAARNFEQDFGIEYPSWNDEAAAIAASFGGIGPAALPSTIILDADHRVAVRLFGAVNEAQLAAQIDRVLDGEAG
ncbi:MAG TPA: TlpA disulfide reductase family protein [Egibacteraceae bacterium]|nr:TlpA disulfide reductase family protein [Egibacteraceae bacterium]